MLLKILFFSVLGFIIIQTSEKRKKNQIWYYQMLYFPQIFFFSHLSLFHFLPHLQTLCFSSNSIICRPGFLPCLTIASSHSRAGKRAGSLLETKGQYRWGYHPYTQSNLHDEYTQKKFRSFSLSFCELSRASYT